MIRYIFTGHIYLATIESITWRDFKGRLMHLFFFNSIKDINTISFKKCVSLLHFPDRIIITMIKSSAHAVSTMMFKWDIYKPYISFSLEHDNSIFMTQIRINKNKQIQKKFIRFFFNLFISQRLEFKLL